MLITHHNRQLSMAKMEDIETGNYGNDSFCTDNESDDDLSPITRKKSTKKKRRRKRSASLPFIEDHTGLYKGLVATKTPQLVEAKESQQMTRNRKKWEYDSEEMTETVKSLNEQSSTRRSSSMPEFYHFSHSKKDESSQHYTTKESGSRQRNKLTVAETDLELKEERFKLPVISSSISSKSSQGQKEEIEALSHTVESTKIQRKTYLPHINSNNGSIFMKSR